MLSTSELDNLLTAQIIVAWAGETAEQPRRLGWWRSDLISQFGGHDLFRRLLPRTWEWAALQAAREAARRADGAGRSGHHEPDSIRSLYHLGFEIDEDADERLLELKRSEQTPLEALPGLALVVNGWDREAFEGWVRSHGEVRWTAGPIGRRIRTPDADLPGLLRHLVGALVPLAADYPLPHFVHDR